MVDEKKNNKWILLYAKNSFTKFFSFCCRSALFYFEIKIIEETFDQICYSSFGFNNINPKLFICNHQTLMEKRNKEKSHFSFSWIDEDIFGCGIVFPKINDSITLPYIFFTKNGKEILNKTSLLYGKNDTFRPFIELLSCSVKVNFGEDLDKNPFCYNFEEHKI
ncbi:hypothetical protein Mgra_00000511 [Meloidogyne graminicola]|uniref:Uncharacterized protein n=1 Tax=Meloidogyne graminicola TaxID=189291 RepID=A0A8T0A3U6_9BILA|nr:hypothetical protein Mgra_00000511 [Meloidogyne graminicola]